jgi:hypothetical protein
MQGCSQQLQGHILPRWWIWTVFIRANEFDERLVLVYFELENLLSWLQVMQGNSWPGHTCRQPQFYSAMDPIPQLTKILILTSLNKNFITA